MLKIAGCSSLSLRYTEGSLATWFLKLYQEYNCSPPLQTYSSEGRPLPTWWNNQPSHKCNDYHSVKLRLMRFLPTSSNGCYLKRLIIIAHLYRKLIECKHILQHGTFSWKNNPTSGGTVVGTFFETGLISLALRTLGHLKSIIISPHLIFIYISRVGSRGEQLKQRAPDFPFCSLGPPVNYYSI